MRSASAHRPWYARTRSLFSSIANLKGRPKPKSRTGLKVLALEDRVYPSITPLGEFGVATTTANDQRDPAIAADAAGNFCVVWQGPSPSGGDAIWGQRFDVAGNPIGSEFMASQDPWSSHYAPAVAMAPDGAFVTAWHEYDVNIAGNAFEIFARRYAADGTPLGGEFRVNAVSTGFQTQPAVAVASDGSFVVAFVDQRDWDVRVLDISARRFDANGNPVGTQFFVNETTAYNQYTPSIGMDAEGAFVVGWSSEFQDGWDVGVFARTYAADGTPTSAHDIQLNAGWVYDQQMNFYGLGVAADGTFAAVWASGFGGTNDYDIVARRFNADGTPITGDLPVNTYTTGLQAYGSVAVARDGGFVVTWVSDHDGSGLGVYAQHFAPDGTRVGEETRVNETTQNNQYQARIAVDGYGNFVAAWTSQSFDGSGLGVVSQQIYAGDYCLPSRNSFRFWR